MLIGKEQPQPFATEYVANVTIKGTIFTFATKKPLIHPISRPLKPAARKDTISGIPKLFKTVAPTTAEKYMFIDTDISIPATIRTKNIPTTAMPKTEDDFKIKRKLLTEKKFGRCTAKI